MKKAISAALAACGIIPVAYAMFPHSESVTPPEEPVGRSWQLGERTESFVIKAGFLARAEVIDAVTSTALKRGIACRYERAGNLIRFTISGPPDAVLAFLVGVEWTFGKA